MSADVCSLGLENFSQKYVSPPPSPTDDGGKKTFGAMSVAEEVAHAMGVPDKYIQMAVAYHRLQQGTSFDDAQELIKAAEELSHCPQKHEEVRKMLSEAQQPRKEEDTQKTVLSVEKVQDKEALITCKDAVSQSAEMQAKALAKSEPVMGDTGALREKVQQLAKENHRLRQRKTCRACRKVDLASSGVTFLPCGHFITCETCSEMFDDCPACGKSIMGTVRTFLS